MFLSLLYLPNKSCGACGACSNWDDIQLQYTTREVLSAIGKVWYDYYDVIDFANGLFSVLFSFLHLFHSYTPVHAIMISNCLLLLCGCFCFFFSAKKSIFTKFNRSDDNDLVVQCNHLQLGFTMPCAKAWAWDEVHTKDAVSTG